METILNKAKRYDEVINRMKHYVIDEYGCSRIKVADVFHELKESEDEKWFPKEIAKYLKEKGDFRSCWLAWLEKQCEQKLYVNDNAKEMFIKALERVEEQNNKGYKLTECDKNSWWEDFKAYTSCIIEQKPAWSEEDERNLQGIIDEIEANKNHAPDYDVATYNRFLSWLKSLKERYTWKPSDEQMRTLEHYMHTLVCTKYKEILFGLYSDLKELREE